MQITEKTKRVQRRIGEEVQAMLACAILVGIIGLSIFLCTPRGQVNAGTYNAPHIDLKDYDIWGIPDSLVIAGPSGMYSDIPPGSLLLTPTPRDIVPDKYY